MEIKYIHRELSAVIKEAYRYFSVITVTGPRQSGKTTLLRNLFPDLPYYSLENLDVNNLVDLRRRTRVGMGTCQGELCACRAAGLLANTKKCVADAKADLRRFMNERWKGMYPVSWGETLRENEYTLWVYAGVCGMNGHASSKTEKEAENEI